MSDLWTPGQPKDQPASRQADVERALRMGRAASNSEEESPEIKEMRLNRRANMNKRGSNSVGGGSLRFATGRPRDPMFYWKDNNLPYDVNNPEELKELRSLCRILYQTHPTIASAVDIFSKYPLTGMEFYSKDHELTEFYSTLFFDQLDYEEFLIDVGREHWTVGEAWPLGTFNELLGVWEDDELINPDDVEVIRSPFLKEPRFEMRLPEVIRDIVEKREPEWEYRQLIQNYPELVNYAHRQDSRMPVSGVLLKQLRFKADTFHPRGIPILLRGLRAIMQEETLNAAQDAVASRLYTPLILAKLGATANELGTSQPWIPDAADLDDFNEAVDAALAGDFRMLTYHFAVNMSSVFGRETMPRMDGDFDRLTDRILQVFGLSRTMLSGSSQGQTYAADALNRDLVTQLLATYQRRLKRFVHDRMLVVAEAQEHYDYETKGGKRYPIMEEVLVVDPETGNQRIEEQPKLLVPDLHIRAMNLRDEDTYRQFVEALRSEGVPISMETRLTNVPIDLEDEVEKVREEQVEQAVEAQRTRLETYRQLKQEGLPIPQELRDDFEAKATEAKTPSATEGSEPIPTIGRDEPASTQDLVPTDEDLSENGQDPSSSDGSTVVPLPRNQMEQRQRPPESDEQRAGMPVASKTAQLVEVTEKLAKASDDDDDEEEEPEPQEVPVMRYQDEEGNEALGRLSRGPMHVGRRRAVGIRSDLPLDEQRLDQASGDT